MNNLSDSLHYNLGQYAALTQAQFYNPSSSLQPTPSQHVLESPAQTQQLMQREHVSNSSAPASIASPHLIPESAAITATGQFHLTNAARFQPYTFNLRMPPQRLSSAIISSSPPLMQQQQTATTASIASPASSIHTTMTSTSSVSPIIPATPSTSQYTTNSSMNHSIPTAQQQSHFSKTMMSKMTPSSPVTPPTNSHPPEQCTHKPNSPNSKNNEPPVRVTRPPNAYLLFNKEMRKVLKEQNPTLKVAEISKQIGSRWKNLSFFEKEKYIKEADRLKAEQKLLHPNSMYIRRSRAELVKAGHQFSNSSKSSGHSPYQNSKRSKRNAGSKRGTGKKSSATQQQQQEQDAQPSGAVVAAPPPPPPPPKHPLSAYMWYLTEVRPETMRNFPGSNVSQISKLCADQWHRMSEEARLPWQTKAQMDKERYAREMQIYAIQNDHTLGRGTRLKYRSAATHAVQAAAAAAAAAAAQIQAPSLTMHGLESSNVASTDTLIEPLFYHTTTSSTPVMTSTTPTPTTASHTDTISTSAINTNTLPASLLRTSFPFVQQQHTFHPDTHSDQHHSFNAH